MSLVKPAAGLPADATLALADERVRLSWSDLDPILNRITNGLLALDYSRERRIAVYAQNSAENVLAYVGALLAGVSSVPVNYHLTLEELVYILADSGSSALFVGPENLEIGLEAAAQVGVPTIIGWRCPPRAGVIAWEDWLAQASVAEPSASQAPMPHLHYTSGTTGRPKATETPPSYFPPAASVADLMILLRQRATLLPQGTGVAVGPLYHTGPLTMVRAFAGGIPLVTLEGFDAEKVLAAIQHYRAANSVMVPTHFQRLLALPAAVRDHYDVSSMKRLAHTGAACPRDVKQAMIDWFGPVLIEAYGGTEAGTTNMINSADWLRKPGSVGPTIAPFELVVVGEDGRHRGPNQIGQLYFRDTTGRGIVYHNDPEKTAQAHIAPGVFTLGEVGYVDEEGFVFITDRVSDMIVSGGVNIYPAETELVLLRHPQVADAAVIGAPNREMGEEVKALVIATNPADPPTADDLNAFCRQHLAGYKCPRTYEFVTDIGRNAMGKVNKKALKKLYWPTDRTIGG